MDPSIDRTSGRSSNWTDAEDAKLKVSVQTHGGKNWEAIAALVPGRRKQQCCRRWHKAVDPSIGRESGRSSNCIRTTWTPPEVTSKAKMAEAIKAVLQEYPQAGQNGVDLNGWEIVEDGLSTGSSTARVEYKSGIGNFAKFLNGNKPFVDDLKIEIGDSAVEIRSASRIGDSDLGVNQKRLVFLANAIKAMGWTTLEPKY
jgi:hypothetical protein